MKRSKVLDIIYNTLLSNGVEMFESDIHKLVLDALEEAGMEPPKIKYFNLDKNGKLHYSLRNGELLNMWEAEDET